MSDTTGGGPGTVARRLDHLFNTVHPGSREPFTYKEVADAINEDAGARILSPNYLWQLRKGERTEPSHSRLVAIARFFGVDVNYFSDDDVAERTDEQLEFLTALRDTGVQRIAIRAAGLSPGSLKAILGMIENARQLEGLPDDQPEVLAGAILPDAPAIHDRFPGIGAGQPPGSPAP